ncbi:MAG: 4-hydroxyphenylacetate 3-hydroxylase C-terminal domain-containing protein, partial [Candidatus Binataceae bacterium]
EKTNSFGAGPEVSQCLLLHGCTRVAVKLDFLAGLLIWASEITGVKGNRFAQMQIGEVLGWRHLFWGLTDAMACAPEPWRDGTLLPNEQSAGASG